MYSIDTFSFIRFEVKSARIELVQTIFVVFSSAVMFVVKTRLRNNIVVNRVVFFIGITFLKFVTRQRPFFYKLFGSKKFIFVPRLPVKRATMTEKITRFGVSIEPELLKKFDKIIKKEGYPNRSEKIRDLIRKNLITQETTDPKSESIGTLTMIYDHHAGSLTDRLLDLQHNHTKEILVTTHVHIDHHNCLEVLVLKGKAGNIQKLADNIRALKGIKHGELVITKNKI